jgi:hypothetical protein
MAKKYQTYPKMAKNAKNTLTWPKMSTIQTTIYFFLKMFKKMISKIQLQSRLIENRQIRH